jgi:hypothetical protein
VGSNPTLGTILDMKGKYTKKRFKADKGSSCAMCKPWKHGWEDKKVIGEIRKGIDAEQQLKEL